MLLALAGEALVQQHFLPLDGGVAVEGVHAQGVAVLLDVEDALDSLRADLLHVDLALTTHADCVDLVGIDAVLGGQLVEAPAVAGLQEGQNRALLGGLSHQIFAHVRPTEAVVLEVFDVPPVKERGRAIPGMLALLPAEDAADLTAGEELLRPVNHHSLHLRSPSFLFSPSSVMVLAKSFMVAENFAPSAADTHSTRVRRRSMPR